MYPTCEVTRHMSNALALSARPHGFHQGVKVQCTGVHVHCTQYSVLSTQYSVHSAQCTAHRTHVRAALVPVLLFLPNTKYDTRSAQEGPAICAESGLKKNYAPAGGETISV